MTFRIVTGEKSKSCVVAAIGSLLYLVDSTLEQSGASMIFGLGLFFCVHAAVLLAKSVLLARKLATEENRANLLRFVVVATLVAGVVAVCCIYVSGRAFNSDWPSYVSALVIGGLSASFHIIPLEKFKRKPEMPGVSHNGGKEVGQ